MKKEKVLIVGGSVLLSIGLLFCFTSSSKLIDNFKDNYNKLTTNVNIIRATDSNVAIPNATNSNATSNNLATNSNATNSNATDSNLPDNSFATDSNATDSNLPNNNFDNNKIDNAIIDEIKNSDNNLIRVNAINNHIVSKDLFDAIKNSDKTLVISNNNYELEFRGTEIKDSKSIDVNISMNSVVDDEKISKLINKGIVLNLADNGVLPGKALARIRIFNSLFVNELNSDKIMAYYYDAKKEKFSLIEKDITKNVDNFYEFSILHNSKIVLVSESIPENLVFDKNIVDFQKNDKINLLLISLGVLVAIFAIIIIVVFKRKSKKEVISGI